MKKTLTTDEAFDKIRKIREKHRKTPEELREVNSRILIKQINREPLTDEEKQFLESTTRYVRETRARDAFDAECISNALKRRTVFR